MTKETISLSELKQQNDTPNSPPGKMFLKFVLEKRAITLSTAALDLNLTLEELHGFLEGTKSVDAEFSLKLADYTGVEPQFWLNSQANFDKEKKN